MAIGMIKRTAIRIPDVDWEDRSVRIKVGNVKPAQAEPVEISVEIEED